MSIRYYDWIAHFGRRTPTKPAVVDLPSERQFSYAQFDARISRLAAHLRDQSKIKRGDRVAVLALNTLIRLRCSSRADGSARSSCH